MFLALISLGVQCMFCYVLCLLATNITLKTTEFACIAYDSMWYKLPVTEQRFVALMIQMGLIKINLTGYDMVLCNLPTFKEVSLYSESFRGSLRMFLSVAVGKRRLLLLSCFE